MKRSPYSPQDNVWTLFQTLTIRDIAKSLGVDRRTVQRWKNQGMLPKPPNAARLSQSAQRDRRDFGKRAQSKREHLPLKKLAVPLIAQRGYGGTEVSAEDFQMMKARVKTDKKYQYDLFRTQKDKRGKRHFFRYQPSQTILYDVQRARDMDIVALILAHRGEGRSMSLVYRVMQEYETDAGDTIKIGRRNASPYVRLDMKRFSTAQGIEKFLTEWRSGKRVMFVRFTD